MQGALQDPAHHWQVTLRLTPSATLARLEIMTAHLNCVVQASTRCRLELLVEYCPSKQLLQRAAPDSWSCTECAARSYKTSQGSTACTLCAINTYSTTVTATTLSVCQPCPDDSTTMSVMGSDKIDMCFCDLGFALSGDHTSCEECNP